MSNLLFLLENEEKMRYNGVEKQRKGRDACEKKQHGGKKGGVEIIYLIASAFVLQSARAVWKTLRHPSTKNPRKFMQTYCIFIHLGV